MVIQWDLSGDAKCLFYFLFEGRETIFGSSWQTSCIWPTILVTYDLKHLKFAYLGLHIIGSLNHIDSSASIIHQVRLFVKAQPA